MGHLLSMPTPSEQKALAFVAIVILLGGAVRVLRAGSSPDPTPLDQQALARQATAADSASTAARAKKANGTRSRRVALNKRDTVPKDVAGVVSVPPSFARPDRPFAHSDYGTPSGRRGFPPPNPRYDTPAGGRPAPASEPPARSAGRNEDASFSAPGEPLDLDVASARAIEGLPRIGPALANRIVANRDSFGPFLDIDGLRRVKGLGAATLERLSPLVTFSGKRSSSSRP